MLDLPLVLEPAAGGPLSVQVAEGLRDAAAAGTIRVGDRLPSTRALAAALGCSRTVTAAAYEQLLAEGWIEGRQGAGTFLVAAPQSAPADYGPLRVDPDSVAGLDLRPGTPWAAGLRKDAWRRAWRTAADRAPLTRPVRAGLPEYRAAVTDHLLRHRGLPADPSRILATIGTTGGLQEVIRAVLDPGALVAIEEPGYPRAAGTLRAAGLDVRGVPVDDGGLVVEALPDRARLVFCTPAHQYPLGARMSARRRLELIDWARARDAWIVEDDYDGELRHEGRPLPLLAGLAPDLVVHLGTMSKILTQTVGVGWMVAPDEVADAVLAQRHATGTGPSAAGQLVVVEFARSGDLARHLRRVRRELLARRDLLGSSLRAAGLAVLGDRAGAHLTVPLPDPTAERTAVARCAAAGIHLDGLRRCYLGEPGRFGVTVGYAAPADRATITAHLPPLLSALSASTAHRPSHGATRRVRAG